MTAAEAPPFDPDAIAELRLGAASIDIACGRISLGYTLGTGLDFSEIVDLGAPIPAMNPARTRALQRAVDVLHLFAGVSYFKAAFPPRLDPAGATLSPRLAALVNDVYRHGLAEAALRNDLPAPVDLGLTGTAVHAAVALGLGRRALVSVGGGKDSIVALEETRRDCDVLLFSVGDAQPVRATADISGLPRRSITRRIDPALIDLNLRGARNGHIPVTAITSVLAVIVALIEECDEVIMANERSASVGSTDWHGMSVNHQWSKGWDFERAFADLVREEIASDLAYFSLLRSWSELAIAQRFAALPEYHRAFTSCNRVFRLRDATATWCGECDKCRFVTLVLAPWMVPAEVAAIIGRNLLADRDQIDGFRALLGIEDAAKPFDCVGEIEESRAALQLLSGNRQWMALPMVAQLRSEMPPLSTAAVEAILSPAGPDGIPERHAAVRRAFH